MPNKKLKDNAGVSLLKWKFSRYILFYKYVTIQKLYNLISSLISWLLNNEHLKTSPSFLRVEITRKCEVDCLFCNVVKDNQFYSFDKFKQLVDKLKKNLFIISLYEIGEPLEHRDVIEFIKYSKSNKIGTIISSSLSIEKPDSFWKELVTSGLDRLIVAIDGITKETYNKYRRNGDFDLVLENLKKIVKYRNEYKSSLLLEWQMVEFKWNQHELSEAKSFSKEHGCNSFRLIKDSHNKRYWSNFNYVRKRNCIHPFISLLVTAYDVVRPCPIVYNIDVSVGNFNNQTYEEVWNGDEIKRIRNKKKIKCRDGCKTCRA